MEWPSIINNTELCVLSQKIFLHLYDLRVWYMKVLITFVLLLAAWAGCPLEVMAQQANTTVSRTTVAKDKEPDSVEISAYDNKIVVENAPAGSKLEVYSVVGIRVKEIPMKQPSGEYTVDLAKGYYIVRIGDTVRKHPFRRPIKTSPSRMQSAPIPRRRRLVPCRLSVLRECQEGSYTSQHHL